MSLRYLSSTVCGLTLLLSPVAAHAQTAPATSGTIAPPAAATPKTPDVPVDAASQAIAEAMVKMNANDLDGAIAKLTDAIKANPKISLPYFGRASIYYQKKMYPEAEADFKSASLIEPKNIVLQFNVVEMEFAQKQYDKARAGYATLVNDPQMGDLAAYKVFLCDLLAGHEALAQKERDAFDSVDSKPSYFFSRAAWDLYHKNNDGARSWLTSVANIFPSAKITYYALPLKDLGLLPVPPSNASSAVNGTVNSTQ